MIRAGLHRGLGFWHGGMVATLGFLVSLGTLTPAAFGSVLPTVQGLEASEVTETNAVLGTAIDPVEGGAHYQFQIAASPSEFASEILCPKHTESSTDSVCTGTYAEDVLPIGEIWDEPQHVALNLNEVGMVLQPGSTYYYRVLAARAVGKEGDEAIDWEVPTVMSETRGFTTDSGLEPSIPPDLSVPDSKLVPAPILPPRPVCENAVRREGKVRCVKPQDRLPRFCRVSTADAALRSSARRTAGGVALLVDESRVPAGAFVYARLANFRATPATYGHAFSIYRRTRDGWQRDPSTPAGPWPKSRGRLAPETAGKCYIFRVPVKQQAGRYQISTWSIQLSPRTKRGLAHRSANFIVTR